MCVCARARVCERVCVSVFPRAYERLCARAHAGRDWGNGERGAVRLVLRRGLPPRPRHRFRRRDLRRREWKGARSRRRGMRRARCIQRTPHRAASTLQRDAPARIIVGRREGRGGALAGVEEELGDGGVAAEGGGVERGPAALGDGEGVGAGGEELPDNARVALPRGAVQRGAHRGVDRLGVLAAVVRGVSGLRDGR